MNDYKELNSELIQIAQHQRQSIQDLQSLYSYYDQRSQQKIKNKKSDVENQNQFDYSHQNFDFQNCEEFQQVQFGFQQYFLFSQTQINENLQNPAQKQIFDNFAPIKINQTNESFQTQWINSRSDANKSLKNENSNSKTKKFQSRSLKALVSAQKKKKITKIYGKTISERSFDSSSSVKNNLVLENKFKNKNDPHQSQPIFLNPLTYSSAAAIDSSRFQKIYKCTQVELTTKIKRLEKDLMVLGEKFFFKNPLNMSAVDQIFKTFGLKSVLKLGKSKSCRQLRAINRYINFESEGNNEVENAGLGDQLMVLDRNYINHFRLLMGFSEMKDTVLDSKKLSFSYGSQKLQRKR